VPRTPKYKFNGFMQSRSINAALGQLVSVMVDRHPNIGEYAAMETLLTGASREMEDLFQIATGRDDDPPKAAPVDLPDQEG